jgi:flagellar protein FlgJ
MASSPVDAQTGTALNGLASDARSLDQLRRAAAQDPAKAVKQVATQFEALFMQMVLKSMREATPKSGMLDSNEQQTYTSMLDEQLAQKIAAGGTGLADVIARQLSRNLPPAAAAGTATAAVPAAPPLPTGEGRGEGPPAPAVVPAPKTTGSASAPSTVLSNLRAAAAVRARP